MNPTRLALRTLAAAGAAAGLALSALGMDFSASLSPPERLSIGISQLAPAQVQALDLLVARDVSAAHDGGVSAFASGFVERLSPSDFAKAGVNRLDVGQRYTLDRLVARAIALGPPPSQAFTYRPPAPAPVATDVDITPKKGPELHGDLSLTVGGDGHGHNFTGTSVDAYLVDEKHGFAIGAGFSQFRGKGLIALCGPGGPLDPIEGGPGLFLP